MPKKTNSSDNSDLSEESALFREAMQGTKPLGSSDKIKPGKQAPKVKLMPRLNPAQRLHEELGFSEESFDAREFVDGLEYRRPGLQDNVLRKLKRGQFPRQDQLDLHGMTIEQARTALASFLIESKQRNLRCVRIIHGKGLRSGERGPVLKARLSGWLTSRQETLAFCPAQRTEGGSGAVYVLLRNPEQYSD